MAQTLRQPLTPGMSPVAGLGWPALLAVALVGVIVGPLLPGLWLTLAPAAHAPVWAALWADPQWPQALQATLTSALLGTALALFGGAFPLLWRWTGQADAAAAICALLWVLSIIAIDMIKERRH